MAILDLGYDSVHARARADAMRAIHIYLQDLSVQLLTCAYLSILTD